MADVGKSFSPMPGLSRIEAQGPSASSRSGSEASFWRTRRYPYVGSIEVNKMADLLILEGASGAGAVHRGRRRPLASRSGLRRRTAPRLFPAGGLPGPGDVNAMTIKPMTAADDADFANRVKGNPNVPQWLKDAL